MHCNSCPLTLTVCPFLSAHIETIVILLLLLLFPLGKHCGDSVAAQQQAMNAYNNSNSNINIKYNSNDNDENNDNNDDDENNARTDHKVKGGGGEGGGGGEEEEEKNISYQLSFNVAHTTGHKNRDPETPKVIGIRHAKMQGG